VAVVAPPPTPEPKPFDADPLDALIEEARRRARRRRIGYAACALVALIGAGVFFGVRGGGVNAIRSTQNEASGVASTRRGSSSLLAVARMYRGESHILLVDPSGRSAPRDLGRGLAPSWSPAGRELVFGYEVGHDGRGFGGGLERIFVMNANGSGRHPLPVPALESRRVEDWGASWSPDGTRIAFTRTAWPAGAEHTGVGNDFGRSAIYVFDLAHGGLRRVSLLSHTGDLPLGVTWSPDGRRLAYLGESGWSYAPDDLGLSHGCAGLHVTNADGTDDRTLVAASRFHDGGCIGIWTPAWSPDGRSIAFSRSTRHFGGGMDLYLISPDGKDLHRLTHQPNLMNHSPTWSPDGNRIAFAFGRRDRRGPGPGGPNQMRTVVVIDRDGGNRHIIARLRGNILGSPAW
jgi:Tol biopolymer transport system component